MQPQDFLLQAFSVTIRHPFAEERLGGQYAADILNLSQGDQASLDKARMCAISMVLYLAHRAVMESFLDTYGDRHRSPEGLTKVMIAGTKMYDTMVEAKRGEAGLPAYADAAYFPRWRLRYEKSVLDSVSDSLKMTVLSTFFGHATFDYEKEPAIYATDNSIMSFGSDIFDNYVIGYRDLLGAKVLQ